MNKGNDIIEIDILDLAYRLWKKIHYIILCLLLGALLFNAYAFFMVHPTYESTSKIYIVATSTDAVVNSQDINVGTSLTPDYNELILSDTVLTRVKNRLALDTDVETLASQINIVNPTDTRILNITATANDPALARVISQTVSEVAVDYLPKAMNTAKPNIAQQATYPKGMAGPNYLKYTLLGGVLGALLMMAYLVVRFLMDETVHSSEEMERYFNLVPLTVIPKSKGLK